ncbi:MULTISPECIES: autotransporter assembly complex protein TamA [Halocynthiibacter]|uniref:Autotransporter assembly complex protein TamA n=1 Tax=Halocynthiibacter halioticoli TaxID=2986804 RepID=A0AAE3J0H3_9RHOB|nr:MULTISPECIES: autotransporter assembly complex family protein [Halocynthiibacter]MCV6823891.1 autotransporter assembly complex protein TamA [Halocynthiibacter halioticoli]MCW4056892.1 autotransporter assembly complex protein TamA [Halocynthiibacter sp. SDUM655004]
MRFIQGANFLAQRASTTLRSTWQSKLAGHWLRRGIHGLAFLGATASAAFAFDASLKVSPANEELQDTLEAQSLTFLLTEQETENASEIVSTALADYGKLLGALYEQGYFGAVISIKVDGREAGNLSPVVPPTSVNRIVIDVQQGPQFKFGKAQVSPIAPGTVMPPEFATGQIAGTPQIENAVSTAVTGWRDVGHAKVEPSGQKIVADHRRQTLDAEVQLAPGRQLKFGDLNVTGTERMKPARVQEIAGLPTGKVFSPKELSDSAKRLRRTGIFQSVSVTEADNANPDGTLDIDLFVTENKLHRFGFGGELSTDRGLGVSTYWLHRNLFGGGERLRVELKFDGISNDNVNREDRFQVRFERPATFNPDIDFFTQFQLLRSRQENYEGDFASFEVGIRRYAGDDYIYNLGLGYRAGNVEDIRGKSTYHLVAVRYSGFLDKRDDQLAPTSGYYLNPEVTPFFLFDDSKFALQSYVDARFFQELGDTGTVLAVRGQIGSIAGISLDDTPGDLLYYSGGTNTVRGFSYLSVGIDYKDGLLGGRSFFASSIEGRFRLKNKEGWMGDLGFVAFYDVGYVGSESFPDGSNDTWHAGAGVGVRYYTSFGPIRFDVAVPVSERKYDSDYQIYLGIGEAF